MFPSRELDWLRHSVGVLSPCDRSVLSIRGDDAREWLQGQLTNQTEGAQSGDSVYGFVLTLKGRVLADAWAYFHDDGIWLEVPDACVNAVVERLERYIIMEDVDLEHVPQLAVLLAQGPRSEQVQDAGWPCDRLGTGGRAWLVNRNELDEALEAAAARATALGGGRVGERAWGDAHIVVGRPRFGIDFGDWTYPQETGLTAVAVSFEKGCYIGQETVVMLENRGKAPKLLYRWRIEGKDAPKPRTSIIAHGAVVGEVTSAVAGPDGVAALGFLKRNANPAEPGSFEVAGRPARALGSVSEALAQVTIR